MEKYLKYVILYTIISFLSLRAREKYFSGSSRLQLFQGSSDSERWDCITAQYVQEFSYQMRIIQWYIFPEGRWGPGGFFYFPLIQALPWKYCKEDNEYIIQFYLNI